MINFDSLTLKAFINENRELFESGRIQKVQQPSRHEILLGIRALGKNHKLYMCVDPKYPHIALLSDEGEELRNIEMPQKPPMFCMLLRKHMEGSKIKAVRQPEYERIFEIYFESYNELGARVPMVLACELMGKYSNIILYSYETNVIMGCAHNVSSEKSREREVSGGMPYIYPPKPKKRELTQVSPEEFFHLSKAIQTTYDVWLNENFHYISLALAKELCNAVGIGIEKDKIISTPKEKIFELYNLLQITIKLENLSPSISHDKKLFSIIGLNPEASWIKQPSVNSMLDLYFGNQVYQDKFARLKASLQTVIKKELKKEKSRLNQHTKTLESIDKAEKYREYADLIMANLYKIQSCSESVILENFFDNNQLIEINLDPAISASDNAQKYYKLYNKSKSAIKVSEEILLQIKEQKNYLESIKTSIDQSESIKDLKEIQDELIGQNLMKSKQPPEKSRQKAKKEQLELTEFTFNEYKVYLGKNNKQNDYLISKIAYPNDIWLHTQNIPGSHVLIKVLPETLEVPDEVLLKAAQIAAKHSEARDSNNVPVIFTRRKYLKKPPAAKPGYVIYSHEKTIIVNPEEYTP